MKKILTSLPLLLCALLAHTTARGQDWRWTGAVSTNWSDMANWTNNNNTGIPDSVDDFNGQTIRIGADTYFTGNYFPSNQDIGGLVLNALQITPSLTNHLVIRGKPFSINSYEIVQTNTDYEVQIYNHIAFNAANNSLIRIRCQTRFYGTLSEFGVGNRIHNHDNNWGNGNVHFYGSVLFTGGITNTQGSNRFYGMETTGGIPGNYRSGFFGGTQHFLLPPGAAEYEYDFPPEKGVSMGFNAYVPGTVTAVFNAPFVGGGQLEKNDGGILEFTATTNTFTGNFRLQSGLLIVKGGLGYGTAANSSYRGSIDLDGVDMLGRNMSFSSENGHNDDGTFRNQNPDSESKINGDITAVTEGNCIQFGGVGDILYTGDIVYTGDQHLNAAKDNRRFAKAGPGTLTFSGTSLFNGPVNCFGGTLVLDYGITNSLKVATNVILQIAGKLILRGNEDEDTLQPINQLQFGSANDDLANRVRISPEGRGDKTATLRVNSFSQSGVSPVDFAPGKNGFILASTNNVSNISHFDALHPRYTYKGKTFARVSDTEKDGFREIEPVPDEAFVENFASFNSRSFVDIKGHPQRSGDTNVGAIRFNDDSAPASLTLADNSYFTCIGDSANDANTYNGSILVTPRVGTNTVEINGIGYGRFDQGEYGCHTIHQYNTNAALVINAVISHRDRVHTSLMKTGPGELVLTHTNSAFNRLYVCEGTITFKSIADANENSSLGLGWYNSSSYPLLLGDATLRYAGDDPKGHSSNRRICLRGFGTIEASGAGALTFSHPNPFEPPNNGKNQLLTLSGIREGVGIIEGSLGGLRGGRLHKRGEGTWILNGESPNIIWGAEIFDGTLVVNGSLGRDVTVHTNGTLSGSGRVQRNLIVKKGATLSLDPYASLTVGKNLVIDEGAEILLPKNIPAGEFVPVVEVGGKIIGTFANPPQYAFLQYSDNAILAKYRPFATLFLLK